MKLMTRNMRTIHYALYLGEQEVLDEDGYRTGEKEITFGEVTPLECVVSASTGQAEIEQFGNLANYDKVIYTADTDCPIDEHSHLWIDADTSKAYDYAVVRVAKSLNSVAIAIRKVETGLYER